ncbi:MAG: hypothetical protein V1929_09100 [bacterium]
MAYGMNRHKKALREVAEPEVGARASVEAPVQPIRVEAPAVESIGHEEFLRLLNAARDELHALGKRDGREELSRMCFQLDRIRERVAEMFRRA